MGDPNPSLAVCRSLSRFAVLFGAAGMTISFLFLAADRLDAMAAGAPGFVAGAVLLGSGLISLAMLTRPRGETFTPVAEDTARS